jgi:hypothetical protein
VSEVKKPSSEGTAELCLEQAAEPSKPERSGCVVVLVDRQGLVCAAFSDVDAARAFLNGRGNE